MARSFFCWPRTCSLRIGCTSDVSAVASSQSALKTSLAYTKFFEPEQVSLIILLDNTIIPTTIPVRTSLSCLSVRIV